MATLSDADIEHISDAVVSKLDATFSAAMRNVDMTEMQGRDA